MQEIIQHSFLSRLKSSFLGVLLGILLFIASFFVLWINEGVQKSADLVERSTVVSVSEISSVLETSYGDLFAVVGSVSGDIPKRGTFINLTPFVLLDRFSETYSWVEITRSEEEGSFGGEVTETITHTYEKQWREIPPSSNTFAVPQGHENFSSQHSSTRFFTPSLFLEDVSVSSGVSFPLLPPLLLTPDLLLDTQAQIVEEGRFLFVSRDGTSTYSNPKVGDTRLSFFGIRDETLVTVVGTISDRYSSLNTTSPSLARYVGEHGDFYALYVGDYEQALATAHSLDSSRLWIFRGLGFLLMFLGLLLMSQPVSVFLSFIPLFGHISSFILLILSLILAVVLSAITIILSVIAHTAWLLVITLAILFILSFWYLRRRRSRRILK